MENLSEFIAGFNANKAVADTALTRQDWIFNPEKVYSLNIENPIVIESAADIPSSWYSENNTILTFPDDNEIVSNGPDPSITSIIKNTTLTINGKLNNLINGTNMFNNRSNLTSFESDLPNLTNGSYMFQYCSKLTSFESELPNLTNGNYMFDRCKLDYESLKRIANSLPDRTDLAKANMHLGYATNITPEQKTEINDIIVNKNWTTTWG